jgi:hypothetical protein
MIVSDSGVLGEDIQLNLTFKLDSSFYSYSSDNNNFAGSDTFAAWINQVINVNTDELVTNTTRIYDTATPWTSVDYTDYGLKGCINLQNEKNNITGRSAY